MKNSPHINIIHKRTLIRVSIHLKWKFNLDYLKGGLRAGGVGRGGGGGRGGVSSFSFDCDPRARREKPKK